MGSNKGKFTAVGLVTIIIIGLVLVSYKFHVDKKKSLICANSHINVILKMHEAENLLDSYLEDKKNRPRYKHLIKRQIEKARLSSSNLIENSRKSEDRFTVLKRAIDDWEGYSNAVISALSKVDSNGFAPDTGEIPAFAELSTENFLESMFVAFSTFSNVGTDPYSKPKQKFMTNLSQSERNFLSKRLEKARSEICLKQKEKGSLSGIEWSIVGTKHFLDNLNLEPKALTDCTNTK